jgi:predicted alpha-1,6-mannanase (GH76 family)
MDFLRALLDAKDAAEAEVEKDRIERDAMIEQIRNSQIVYDEMKVKLAVAVEGLERARDEIDEYIKQEYPLDNLVHARCRRRDYSANPARATLAQIQKEGTDNETT